MTGASLQATHQSLTHTTETLRKAYQDGKLNEVLSVLDASLPGFHNLAAWCHYRQKNYAQCLEQVEMAEHYGETQSTLAIRAYLYSYDTEFKNEDKLLEILPRLHPENVDGINAVVISARSPKSKISWEQASTLATEAIDLLASEPPTVSHANLLHNMARLFLDKTTDYAGALSFINAALSAYGTETNFHHCGAANYWKSVILERSGDLKNAYEAALDSLAAWQKQRDLEPGNKEWKTRVNDALKREQQLALKR